MSEANDDLIPRLAVIEGQPLETRAAAFTQIHDELRGVLDGTRVPERG